VSKTTDSTIRKAMTAAWVGEGVGSVRTKECWTAKGTSEFAQAQQKVCTTKRLRNGKARTVTWVEVGSERRVGASRLNMQCNAMQAK
jgi:hypothetical protein